MADDPNDINYCEEGTGGICHTLRLTREENGQLKAEVERLRAMIDQTADGALVLDCDKMFCPRCCEEVRLTYDLAYCDECGNEDSFGERPLPLLFGSCYSTREAAEAEKGDEE